ncbi:bacteriocin immunity protein [Lactobacillus johnsonii]|uniref:bacteriocin immunity protein n=1 Tax=Lactobacillus johnsonii TaxID=33959 RepID=UPI0028E2080A|nr:bacteriocin immunity protein [Lactobacillus johnsonii]MDT9605053.1 bacteriocin immunity protein [Lactobacillus johnsonii]
MLEKPITKHDEIITVLKDLYTSFNKVQIKAYLPLEQTILKVIAKAENHDDVAAWSNKLVMYLQSQIVLKQIPITKEQDTLINSLSEQCKNTNLNYVYLSPVDDSLQFD